jgi:hypothetical protein
VGEAVGRLNPRGNRPKPAGGHVGEGVGSTAAGAWDGPLVPAMVHVQGEPHGEKEVDIMPVAAGGVPPIGDY